MTIDFSKIKEWQSLAGSFIGAFLPISFALYIRWKDSYNNFLRGLWKIDKFLAYSVNELYELRESIELFIAHIEKDRKDMQNNIGNNFTLDSTNFPLQKLEFERSLFESRTKSIYLSNKLMMCHLMLKNINDSLTEIREEYQILKNKNFDIVFSGKITIANQNQIRTNQLLAVENIFKDAILKKNIPIAVKSLLGARIILIKYLKFWGTIYRIYYEGWLGKRALKENGQELVEIKFKDELKGEYEKVEKMYSERISHKVKE